MPILYAKKKYPSYLDTIGMYFTLKNILKIKKNIDKY